MTGRQGSSQAAIIGLRKRADFLRLRRGFVQRTRAVNIQAASRLQNDRHIGIGFTATRKLGNAVTRNRVKRRLRAAAGALLPVHGRPGIDYVFIATPQTARVSWQQLLDDVETALISLAGRFGNDSEKT